MIAFCLHRTANVQTITQNSKLFAFLEFNGLYKFHHLEEICLGGLQKKWKNYPHSWKQGCGFVVVLLQKIHRHKADGDIFGTWK